MAREFDIQLVAAPAVLPTYAAHNILAGYWQIAYEPRVDPLPDMPHDDVGFLANVINEKRRARADRFSTISTGGDPGRTGIRNLLIFAPRIATCTQAATPAKGFDTRLALWQATTTLDNPA